MNAAPGNWFRDWIGGLGHFALLAREAFGAAFRFRTSWHDLIQQIYFMGVKSQSVVIITGAFTGMVLGAQTFFQFHKVGMDSATLAVVSVSMCSELGPVLTALMVAGRVGASMAAELGTMRVTEQIDALRTMATHPVDYLVAPRLLSGFIVLPLLTAESIAIGIAAAYFIGVHLLGVDPTYSWAHMLRHTDNTDVLTGLIKSVIFGGMIAIIGSYKGMNCGEGAEGVGRATTEAVVYSSIAILISNFFLTLSLGPLLAQLL
jgi:phospholipid/cholesterol/gamma-HCH transport system permease protein